MPEFLKRIKFRREAKELKSVPSIGCKVEFLLPAKEINLAEIFSSGEIERAWDAVKPELQTFEFRDGNGGVNPGDRRAIFYLVSYFKPRSVLEVGTHIGSSTVHIAAAIHAGQENKESQNFVSVDVRDVNDPISKLGYSMGRGILPLK